MALERKRPSDKTTDTADKTAERMPGSAGEDLLSFGSFPTAADLEKTTLDLDAFAPYKPTEISHPLDSHVLSPAELNTTIPVADDTGEHVPAPISLDDVSDFSSYINTSFGVEEPSSDAAPAVNELKVDEAFPDQPSFAPATGRLFVQIGKFSATYQIDADDLLIGRPDLEGSIQPEITIEWDDAISRKHAHVFRRGSNIYIEDLGSTNGTKVNGIMLARKTPQVLEDGDVIHLGSKTELSFYV